MLDCAYNGINQSGIALLVKDDKQREDAELYMKEVLKDTGAENLLLMMFAYSLFIYGFPRVNPYEKYKGKYVVENVIYQSLLHILYEKSEIRYQDYFLSDKINFLANFARCNAHYKMMKGHNEELGTYYRQMFQFFTTIANADESIADEEQKYKYAKLLRSQLNDCEQALLYYNSMSEMGMAWNRRKAPQDNTRN